MNVIPFLLGLAVAGGLVVPVLLRRMNAQAAAAAEEVAGLQAEIQRLRTQMRRASQDQEFLTGFLRDFPRLAGELYSGPKERQIPSVLLQVVMRSLAPRQALVVVRRRARGGEEATSLVVAAASDGLPVTVGEDVPDVRGQLRFVAECQQVMNAEDFAAEMTISGKQLDCELPGVQVDVIAPLVHEKETVGLIALSKPQRTSGDAKAALRLIAQTGAQSLQTAATYSRMKVTAETDGLTLVFNKRHVSRALSDLIYKTACLAYDRRQTGGEPPPSLSVFLFDIDNFKHYNDTNGHVAGDRLLQDLAKLVERNVRRDDIFGRFGGEEFLLVMPETDREQALTAATKLREAIASHGFPFGERQPLGCISISGGVASYPSNGSDAEALLRAADDSLYQAKRAGRNRVLAAVGEYRADEKVPPGDGGQ